MFSAQAAGLFAEAALPCYDLTQQQQHEVEADARVSRKMAFILKYLIKQLQTGEQRSCKW